MILGTFPARFLACALARFFLGCLAAPVVGLLRIGVALGLTYPLPLLMNWPAKTAVLLGFIVSLISTAMAIAGEGGMQRDTHLLSFFSPRYDKKAAPYGAA